MVHQENFSKALLFLPSGVFILLNFLSAYYITSMNVYNGDFLGVPLRHSHFEVWLYAFLASLPYIALYFVILKIKPTNELPIKIPKLFMLFAYFILFTALFLTVVYQVGMTAQEIYSVPTAIKPFVVVVNRIDPLALTGILLLSPYVKWRTALIISILLILISIYRGSLAVIPVLLIIHFYRSMTYINPNSRLKINRLGVVISFAFILLILIYLVPVMYEIRESVRGIEAKNGPVFDLIFGKLIGRLSNLSALLVFDWRYDLFNEKIEDLQAFSYLIDCFKYIWGGFIKVPVMNHYDFFTSINDNYASGFYAMQTGVIPAISISIMKSPVIGIFDILITIFCIYSVVKLSTFFLGYSGKYLSISLLILATLSGAPNQFSAQIYNLTLILVVFSIIKYIALRYAVTK